MPTSKKTDSFRSFQLDLNISTHTVAAVHEPSRQQGPQKMISKEKDPKKLDLAERTICGQVYKCTLLITKHPMPNMIILSGTWYCNLLENSLKTTGKNESPLLVIKNW